MAIDLAYVRIQAARRHVLAAIAKLERDVRAPHPAQETVDAALEDLPGEPIPRPIVEYVRRVYVRGTARRPGPAPGQHTQARDEVVWRYCRSLEAELRASEQSREVRRRAVEHTAEDLKLSVRTVYRILSARRPSPT